MPINREVLIEPESINVSWRLNGVQREINENNDAVNREHCGFLNVFPTLHKQRDEEKSWGTDGKG